MPIMAAQSSQLLPARPKQREGAGEGSAGTGTLPPNAGPVCKEAPWPGVLLPVVLMGLALGWAAVLLLLLTFAGDWAGGAATGRAADMGLAAGAVLGTGDAAGLASGAVLEEEPAEGLDVKVALPLLTGLVALAGAGWLAAGLAGAIEGVGPLPDLVHSPSYAIAALLHAASQLLP